MYVRTGQYYVCPKVLVYFHIELVRIIFVSASTLRWSRARVTIREGDRGRDFITAELKAERGRK